MNESPAEGTTTAVPQADLAEVFVGLADTLVDDYDIVELMERLAQACVGMLGASAAGLMIADLRGSVQVLASSSEQVHLLEVLQVQVDEGPCRDCVRSGQVVNASDLSQELERWPTFARLAMDGGFTGVQALPLRLRSETIGALNLLFRDRPVLGASERRIAQALADVATIGVLQQRAVHRGAIVAEQLQRALNSRIVIEQAKGMLAQQFSQGMDAAFAMLRLYARNNNVRLTELAASLVSGGLAPEALLSGGPRSSETR